MPLPLAALVSAAVALAGWAARWLTAPGALTAAAVGTAVLGGTGWVGAAALGAFFLSASVVSRLTDRNQPIWVDAQPHRRSPSQVLANGGVASAGGLLALVAADHSGLWIVVAGLAAAAADTWATSLGVLSRRDPVLLTTAARVPKGTSGGVTLIGTVGGLAGACVVAGAAWAAGAPAAVAAAGTVTGLLGMVADSVLGATVQGRFHCPACALPSERRKHRCGTATRLTGGCRWVGNDGVNLLSTAFAGGATWLWWACCCR
jgi:uncharacterized protein (TIGR00297 family)